MPDWTASMQQTYEFYTVDPETWGNEKKVDVVKSGTINLDEEHETLGDASFEVTEELEEQYIRAYLITIQNGVEERTPLGTFLCQTPGSSFTGTVKSVTIDGYTPLVELKEKRPPIGYSLMKNRNVLDAAFRITSENVRSPVVKGSDTAKLSSNFVSNLDDTYLTFLTDLLLVADYRYGLDPLGRILFEPKQELTSLQPVWTYDDGNSSILYPDISVERDLYEIPNVVEVVYSKDDKYLVSTVTNNDSGSSVSVRNRGRKIVHRETNPDIKDDPTKAQLDSYARNLLRELSSLEYKLTYTHGYCPVRVGDCVRLNYKRAGLTNIRARVIRQSIKLEPGCTVEETAVYTTNLWE